MRSGEETELQSQFSGYIRKPFSRHTLFLALAQFLQQAPLKDPMNQRNSRETLTAFPLLYPSKPPSGGNSRLNSDARKPSQWPALRDSLAINETRAFAHKLFTLGQAAHCPALTTYAATLTTFADAYAIGQMERHLGVFPELVESIEASLTGRDRSQPETIPHV